MKLLAILTLTLSLFLAKGQTTEDLSSLIGQVSGDSIARTIQDLENFESRYCYRPGGNLGVAQYLQQRLQSYGYEAHIDTFHLQVNRFFDNIDRDMYNVRARVNAATSAISDTSIIIGAHLDAIALAQNSLTNTAPGADDNASGCAIMIEVARIIAQNNLLPRTNLEFLAWDAEEVGLYGAYYDCERREQEGANEFIFVFNNDMVATQPEDEPYRLKFYQYDNSVPMANQAVQICEEYTTIIPTSPPSDNDNLRNYSDSKAYNDYGHHAVFTIEHYFTEYYHTEQDLLVNCNMDYAAEVAKYNLAAVCIFSQIFSHSTSISENKAPSLKIYPNPASHVIYLEASGLNDVDYTVTIHDSYGRSVLEQRATTSVSIAHIPSGFYTVTVHSPHGRITEKIIIQ